MNRSSTELKAMNQIRVLSIEAVQKANSGHPGMPLGAAPMAFELFSHHMKHDPTDPTWPDRDRFVLSAGHASMLLYSLLHLFNYGLTAEDLENFRQWNSRTPGHPEYGHTVGVETTTGPLGQGLATAVGMAMAEAHLAARFNTPELKLVDHWTFVLAGDGCMMEGVSSEASSLAGHLKLGKLIVLYDSNEISIEGSTDLAFTEKVEARYKAYGWQVLEVKDGNDLDEIGRAIEEAKADSTRPTLITVRTKIGFASPGAGTAGVHGSPLGVEGVQATRRALGWPDALGPFEQPAEVRDWYRDRVEKLGHDRKVWLDTLERCRREDPERAQAFTETLAGRPIDLSEDEALLALGGKMATRKASGLVLNVLAEKLPALFGGSADLSPSNNSHMKDKGSFSAADYSGRNVHFGVREFAMAAAVNGLALHGGLLPYCATFFVFTDYMKAAMRLSALMQAHALYILTHDSIGVGEDGPTHEPIEHLAMLRSIPGLNVFRPADVHETAAAYAFHLKQSGPTCLVLTRQDLPDIGGSMAGTQKGAYVLWEADGFDRILLASGSEVALVLDVAQKLQEEGIRARVVSMPSMERFLAQPAAYRDEVLPPDITRRLAVEAAATMPWYRFVGLEGRVHGLDRFGASAPGDVLFREFGFTPENLAALAREL